MKRLALTSLVVSALITALASQPWFIISLTSGNRLQVSGFDAYANFAPTLIVDGLAIGLVL